MTKKALFAAALLAAAWANAAPSEAETAHYRQTMSAAGKDLAAGRAEAAFAKIKPLAEQGFAEAQYAVGTMYPDGEGVAQDKAQAAAWYRKAAAQRQHPEVVRLAEEALESIR